MAKRLIVVFAFLAMLVGSAIIVPNDVGAVAEGRGLVCTVNSDDVVLQASPSAFDPQTADHSSVIGTANAQKWLLISFTCDFPDNETIISYQGFTWDTYVLAATDNLPNCASSNSTWTTGGVSWNYNRPLYYGAAIDMGNAASAGAHVGCGFFEANNIITGDGTYWFVVKGGSSTVESQFCDMESVGVVATCNGPFANRIIASYGVEV